jgi:tRNA U34 5-methylaminomethyl-2-thiouridine-forming methyltransferase MnmC
VSRKIIITKDGSPSIEWREGVTYHSTYGALQESQHIFINEGWKATMAMNVFELGLGTGLNALLTLIEAERAGRRVMYETVEAYPLERNYFRELDYCTLLGRPDMKSCFEQLHTCDWEVPVSITPYFTLYKSRDVWPGHVLHQPAELVYYDAFDPVVQPELWTADVFERLAGQLAERAVLVTYCCKGAVRRALQAAGFRVEKRPGPPGKREIVRAWLASGKSSSQARTG